MKTPILFSRYRKKFQQISDAPPDSAIDLFCRPGIIAQSNEKSEFVQFDRCFLRNTPGSGAGKIQRRRANPKRSTVRRCGRAADADGHENIATTNIERIADRLVRAEPRPAHSGALHETADWLY